MVELENATEEELREECRKRGYGMKKPLVIKFNLRDFEED